MKVYTIIDNGEDVFTTTNRLKALEALYKLAKKYENKQDWFWIAEGELR